jgi:hypothetical protein
MPKIQRCNLPPELLDHLLDRVWKRNITEADLHQVLHWIEGNPTVPPDDWFKRFRRLTVCGQGSLIKTFLTPQQTAIGSEID